MRSILLLPLVVRCLETYMYMGHVCFYVCCADCVGVCGIVCCVLRDTFNFKETHGCTVSFFLNFF